MNLAILNMLPIPVLDGGHIVLAIIESIRRKPVNIRVLEVVQTACAVLIIGYMAYVSFFDIGDGSAAIRRRRAATRDEHGDARAVRPRCRCASARYRLISRLMHVNYCADPFATSAVASRAR